MKKSPTCIITHPGQAHRDDFLACCLMLYRYRYDIQRIVRREPTEEELEDETVLVLDVGGEYKPSRRNYDHHQLPKDAAANCALAMVVRDELEMEDEFKIQTWYRFSVLMDSKGPSATARAYGWNEFPSNIMSPVEDTLLRMFEEYKLIRFDDFVFKVMQEIGNRLLDYVSTYAFKMKECFRETHECWAVDLLTGSKVQGIMMLGDTNLIEYLNQVQSQKYAQAAFSITRDDRGPGYRIYRFNDNKHIDLYELEDHPLITFAHKGGFIAKTVGELLPEQVLNLVSLAIVEMV